jgi:hemolysin D
MNNGRSLVPIAAPARRSRAGALATLIVPERHLSDREFLAPALEILETPASPARVAFLWIICALVAVALAWAYFGKIDIISAAQGKFQPTGRVKVIEPLETGKIAAIFVSNDSTVKAGDPLAELDASEAEAEEKLAAADYTSARAESVRRQAELTAGNAGAPFATPALVWPDEIPGQLRTREETVLAADLGQLAAESASYSAQAAQKTAERDKLSETIETQKNLIATLQDRVTMRQTLVDSKSGTRASLIDATETLQYQQTQLAMQQQQQASLSAALEVVKRESEKARQTFLSDNAQKLSDADAKAEDARQRVAKTKAALEHLTLRAPIAGRVQASILSNVGQVVTGGQEVMRVVPTGSRLEIEAYVQNSDIGFVSVGQEAIVKVESFPFTRYGVIKARVTRIARDAIPAPDATAIEGDPAHPTTTSGFAGGERTQNLVFAVNLEPETSSIHADGVDQPLTSGMAVTVELKTGTRRMLEYLFSPLVDVASSAMRER